MQAPSALQGRARCIHTGATQQYALALWRCAAALPRCIGLSSLQPQQQHIRAHSHSTLCCACCWRQRHPQPHTGNPGATQGTAGANIRWQTYQLLSTICTRFITTRNYVFAWCPGVTYECQSMTDSQCAAHTQTGRFSRTKLSQRSSLTLLTCTCRSTQSAPVDVKVTVPTVMLWMMTRSSMLSPLHQQVS